LRTFLLRKLHTVSSQGTFHQNRHQYCRWTAPRKTRISTRGASLLWLTQPPVVPLGPRALRSTRTDLLCASGCLTIGSTGFSYSLLCRSVRSQPYCTLSTHASISCLVHIDSALACSYQSPRHSTACTVRTGFYATECEGFRNRVFFFRKPVWAVVRKTTLRKLNQDMFQVRPSHIFGCDACAQHAMVAVNV
jgi:hypothetical protein